MMMGSMQCLAGLREPKQARHFLHELVKHPLQPILDVRMVESSTMIPSTPRNDYAHNRGLQHKLPAIPDLRFESSYLKKIQPYVKITSHTGRGKQMAAEPLDKPLSGDVHESRLEATNNTVLGSSQDELSHEMIKVRWKMVIWVTIRDQVMSPFVQGIVL